MCDLPESGEVRVGSGITQAGGALRATKAGVVQAARGGKLWVQGTQRRCVVARRRLWLLLGVSLLGLACARSTCLQRGGLWLDAPPSVHSPPCHCAP